MIKLHVFQLSIGFALSLSVLLRPKQAAVSAAKHHAHLTVTSGKLSGRAEHLCFWGVADEVLACCDLILALLPLTCRPGLPPGTLPSAE